MTHPVLGLRGGDALPASLPVGCVLLPTNWRVEPLPPSPWGIRTLAKTGLPGKPGHLFVGLPGTPGVGSGGTWSVSQEPASCFLKPTVLTFPLICHMILHV